MAELPLAAAASAGIIIGVVGFLLISLTIGIVTVRFVQGSSRRYIVAGKSLPLFFVGTMLSAQAIDGNSSLGNTGLVYDFGFWAGATIPLGLAVCLLLTGFIFGRRLNRMNLLTLPDFYFRRYGNAVEGISGILMMISFAVLVAGNFAATGFILERVFDIPFTAGMFIGAGIVLTYTAFGGLFSCAYTDIFQIYIAVIGFWAAFIYFAGGFAGPSFTDFTSAAPGGYLDFTGLYEKSNGALINWATILALGLGDLVALDFMERVFAARNGRTAARGAYWGAGVTLFTVIPTAFIGIFAITLIPDLGAAGLSSSFLVYPEVAINHVPTWIGIFMLAGVLGASMSTANGGILAISAVISRNLVQRDVQGWLLKRPKMGNQMLLILTRIMLVPVVGAALYIAYRSPQPGKYLTLAFDIVFAGALVPLILGLFWAKANTPAALTSLIVGSLLRLIGYFYFNETWGIFHPSENALSYAGIETMIPPVISLILFVIVALATQKKFAGDTLFGVIDYIPPEEDVVLGEDLRGYTPGPKVTPEARPAGAT
jgi:solute:Na+ symporter, SSS family